MSHIMALAFRLRRKVWGKYHGISIEEGTFKTEYLKEKFFQTVEG